MYEIKLEEVIQKDHALTEKSKEVDQREELITHEYEHLNKERLISKLKKYHHFFASTIINKIFNKYSNIQLFFIIFTFREAHHLKEAKFKAELEQMAALNRIQEGKVKLDIGGMRKKQEGFDL